MAYEEEEKKQYMVIKIKKPHHAERLAWIALIAFLLTIIIYQWMIWPEETVCQTEEIVEETIIEQKPAVVETPKEEIKEEKKEESKPETKPEAKTEEKKEEKKLSGKIETAITSVNVEKKSGDFGKIHSISYTIDNQKKDFVPLVRFFLYDNQWTVEMYTAKLIAQCCEHLPQFSLPLKAGAPILESKFNPSNGNGFAVNNLNETKTIRMEVYNKDDTKTLLSATEYSLKKEVWK